MNKSLKADLWEDNDANHDSLGYTKSYFKDIVILYLEKLGFNKDYLQHKIKWESLSNGFSMSNFLYYDVRVKLIYAKCFIEKFINDPNFIINKDAELKKLGIKSSLENILRDYESFKEKLWKNIQGWRSGTLAVIKQKVTDYAKEKQKITDNLEEITQKGYQDFISSKDYKPQPNVCSALSYVNKLSKDYQALDYSNNGYQKETLRLQILSILTQGLGVGGIDFGRQANADELKVAKESVNLAYKDLPNLTENEIEDFKDREIKDLAKKPEQNEQKVERIENHVAGVFNLIVNREKNIKEKKQEIIDNLEDINRKDYQDFMGGEYEEHKDYYTERNLCPALAFVEELSEKYKKLELSDNDYYNKKETLRLQILSILTKGLGVGGIDFSRQANVDEIKVAEESVNLFYKNSPQRTVREIRESNLKEIKELEQEGSKEKVKEIKTQLVGIFSLIKNKAETIN